MIDSNSDSGLNGIDSEIGIDSGGIKHKSALYPPNTSNSGRSTGLRVVYNLVRPVGSRVSSLQILCSNCSVPVMEPVRDELWYRVAMPDFLADGGDGFTMLRDEKLAKINLGEFCPYRVPKRQSCLGVKSGKFQPQKDSESGKC